MVNASLNWASIVGIVLAVGGAVLYFMRSFKPALARDYDVFFAAVGLLCGGILFFQGWRLDPILQFGQFLLAGTTVFFAYESVRLRGITTEQARRSSYFDEEESPPFSPRGGMGSGPWEGVDRFSEPEPLRRRIRSREEEEEDFYRPRRSSRPAIPERAASRMGYREEWESNGPGEDDRIQPPPYRTSSRPSSTDFGSRRRE
ncbi:MAG: Ycf66 family protein, partial [Synechococcaceae cyanobacterium]